MDQRGSKWVGGVEADHAPLAGQDKASRWKCLYHNGRAGREILRRSA